MTQLLVIREYIKNFYTKYEEFIVPLLKFVLGLILFLTINGRMGYMEKIDHVAIVLVAALLCSFLPLGVMVFLSAMFLLLHTYALSAECVVVLLLAYIIVLVIYLRFAPKAHLLLLLTPLLFVWKKSWINARKLPMKSVLPKLVTHTTCIKPEILKKHYMLWNPGTAGILVMTIPITFIPSGMHITVL